MLKRTIMSLFLFTLVFFSENSEAGYDLISQQIVSAGVTKNEYSITGDGNHYANVLVCDLKNPYIKMEVIAGAGRYNEKATVTEMAQRTGAYAAVNGDFFNTALQGTPNGPSIIDGDIKSSPCVLQGVYSLGVDQNNTGHIIPIGFGGGLAAPSGRIYPIDGVNKSYYWYEPTLEFSHENKLQVYTDFWASRSRGWDRCTEVLINEEGVVEQISYGRNFEFAVPNNKKIVQAYGTAEDFIRDNLWVGAKTSLNYNLSPEIDWKFLIGGHALLVDNNEVVTYTKDVNVLGGNRARTAAGISQDGKTVYIVSVEGRTSRSQGMSLPQLSRFMKSIGAFRAVNLDGGGSTAMVINDNGNINRVVNPEGNGAERRVVNGIGLFSTAVPGEMIGFDINGPESIVIGESAYFSIGNAWDGNHKPADIEGLTGAITNPDESLGKWFGNSFLALSPGQMTVNMTADNGISATKSINVLDSSHIEELALNLSQRRFESGDIASAKLMARLRDGRVIELSQLPANGAVNGFLGNYHNESMTLDISNLNGLRAGDVNISLGDRSATERIYDKNTNIVEMFIGSRQYKVNENEQTMDTDPIISNGRTMVPVRFLVEALGGEIEWDAPTQTVLIDYAGTNIQIPIGADTINIDGIDKQIDSPAILKDARTMVPIRFIVEALEMDIEYRGLDQRITIVDENPIGDNISKIRMNIGSSSYYLDGKHMEMDVELFTVKGRTMVPIRFIIEGMGGAVEWDEENMTVLINYEDRKIELPIGSSEISVNGDKVPVDSPAILKDSRSFVPIRFVAESLGMKVGYRPLDQRVTLVKYDAN